MGEKTKTLKEPHHTQKYDKIPLPRGHIPKVKENLEQSIQGKVKENYDKNEVNNVKLDIADNLNKNISKKEKTTNQIKKLRGVNNKSFVNDDPTEMVVKVKIIPPTVHDTLGDNTSMEKGETKQESEKSEKNIKEDSTNPIMPKKESVDKSSVVPEEDCQFDPEGRSAI